MIDSVLKTNPWTYEIKDLNEEKKYIDITTKRYFTTSDYTNFKREIRETKIKDRGLVDNLVKNSSLVKNYDLNKKSCKISKKSRIKSRAI